ncbi:MAG: FixH family protein [Sphingomonadaceae bacterium]
MMNRTGRKRTGTNRFTGWHMTVILVGFFGVVIAVNFTMAFFAIDRFGGVVVENSYVASQKFNGWLDEARSEDRLGWKADIERDTQGRLAVITEGVPQDAKLVAHLRRPLGTPDDRTFPLLQTSPHHYRSADVEPGRWIVRLEVDAGGRNWSHEEHVD